MPKSVISMFGKDFMYVPKIQKYVCVELSTGNVSSTQVVRKTLSLLELRHFSEFALEQGPPIRNDRGEWTSDFIDYGLTKYSQARGFDRGNIEVTHISKPMRVWKKDGIWHTWGGKSTIVTLPPNGWIISDPMDNMYDIRTGLPLRTTSELNDAAGSNFSYFWRGELGAGVLAINRECERMMGDAFEISCVQSPDFSHTNIGYRPVL